VAETRARHAGSAELDDEFAAYRGPGRRSVDAMKTDFLPTRRRVDKVMRTKAGGAVTNRVKGQNCHRSETPWRSRSPYWFWCYWP
jgi:hypothetical protein